MSTNEVREQIEKVKTAMQIANTKYKKSKDDFEKFIKENSKESIEKDFKQWFPELSIGY